MIICSCNIISSNSIKHVIEHHFQNEVPSVEDIMKKHGCSVECATCVRNIKIEIRKHYGNNSQN